MQNDYKSTIKPYRISRPKFDAFIFDLDGVITKTQKIHFIAWRRAFNEFFKVKMSNRRFTKKDYLAYVDGKPRLVGVRSFLDAIGISLPIGKKDDFCFDSVWGIANVKNKYFESALDKNGVEVFEHNLQFVKKLKKYGIKVAVISSSKHCRHILKKVGIYALFDAIVDGTDAERLGLKGKPEPDIFNEAANLLGVRKDRCAIVEDSVAGIYAGKKGKFGLLIGINRGGNRHALLEIGANIVVKDLNEISVVNAFVKGMNALMDNISKEIRGGRKPILFTDYDGTLTPIVNRPELALLSKDVKKTLSNLTYKIEIVIVSGRSLNDIRRLVGLKNVYYSGNHGFEMEINGRRIELDKAKRFLPIIAEAEKAVRKISIKGFLVERKKFSVACHYRLVDDSEVSKVVIAVKKVARRLGLKIKYGKKVIELMPNVRWDKGNAIMWAIRNITGVSKSLTKPLIIYMGDDLTDEDAFRVVNRMRGLSVLVVSKDARDKTSAKYFLRGVEETKEFLTWLDDFYTNMSSR